MDNLLTIPSDERDLAVQQRLLEQTFHCWLSETTYERVTGTCGFFSMQVDDDCPELFSRMLVAVIGLTFQIRISPHKVDALLPTFADDILQNGIDLPREAGQAKEPARFMIEEYSTGERVESFLTLDHDDIDAVLLQEEGEQETDRPSANDEHITLSTTHRGFGM